MAKKPEFATKRVAISKANAQMVGVVAAAAFIAVFCLFASKAAFSQNRYQARVTDEKQKAFRQLEDNVKAFDSLRDSYKDFDGESTNVIGGSRSGQGDKDGANSKIVLDALPSSYDFPALTSSLEKILRDSKMKVSSITGTDDQLNQANASAPTPKPVDMPFSFSVSDANFTSANELIDKLQKSIRPILVDKVTVTGGNNSMTLTVDAHTFYQPAKNLDIKTKVVK
jgi:hypothetical protein